MTEREARLLQAGDTAGLLHALLKGMSPGEREVLFALLETPLTYADYEALAAEEYGVGFMVGDFGVNLETPADNRQWPATTPDERSRNRHKCAMTFSFNPLSCFKR